MASFFSDVDDLLTSGTKIEKIITIRPDIEPVTAYLLYIAYDGWIFSGRHVWRVDKILMKSGSGDYLSHCKANEAQTVLRSGIPSEFNLLTGDCAVPIIGLDHYLYKHQKKPAAHDNHFPPQISNEPLNALLPPPPPPPASSTSSSKPDVFVMDTKIIQIAEAADNAGDNSIQINDEVAEVRLDSLKKNEYHTIEIWDSLAPNSVPAVGLDKPTKPPSRPALTSTESPASFWPGFLDFFSSGSSSTTTRSPAHQRPSKRPSRPTTMKKPPTQMITLSTKNGTQQQHVTMHHLSSDEQLTILKVDDEEDTNNTQPLTINDNDVSDEKYIVLHKLPNGEALNLENLETYSSMADVEDGIQRNTPYHPRSLMPNIDFVIPPSIGDMLISERPIAKPDIYEPIPLDQLEDLEAMPAFEQKPVYIINPLKGDLNESGEILPPTEEEVEEAIMQANVELYKLNQTSDREDKFLHGVFSNNLHSSSTGAPPVTSRNLEDVSKKQFFETQTVVYDFNWTPIPKRPTFGPARPPPHFRYQCV